MSTSIRPSELWNFATLDALFAGATVKNGARLGDFATVTTSGGSTTPAVAGIYEAVAAATADNFTWLLVSDVKFTAGPPKSGAYSVGRGEIVVVNAAAGASLTTPVAPSENDRFGVFATSLGAWTITGSGGALIQDPNNPGPPSSPIALGPGDARRIFLWRYYPVFSSWVLESVVTIGGGGGPTGRWDESLSAGPNTNGQHRWQTVDDRLYWSSETDPLLDPTVPPVGGTALGFPSSNTGEKFSLRNTLPPGAAVFQPIGAIFNAFGATTSGNFLRVNVVATSKPGVNIPSAIYETTQIWEYSAGVWIFVESLLASTTGAANFQIAASAGTLNIEALLVPVPQEVEALVEVVKVAGFSLP